MIYRTIDLDYNLKIKQGSLLGYLYSVDEPILEISLKIDGVSLGEDDIALIRAITVEDVVA
jgi:hypothetical protein